MIKKYSFLFLVVTVLFQLTSCKKDVINMDATVQGIVMDAVTGQPLQDVAVSYLSNGKFSAPSKTLADGTYSFSGLVSGDYIVKYALTGYAAIEYPVSVQVNAEPREGDKDYKITVTQNAYMYPKNGKVKGVAYMKFNSGQIRPAKGQTVVVSYFPANSGSFVVPQKEITASTTDGSFQIDSIPAGADVNLKIKQFSVETEMFTSGTSSLSVGAGETRIFNLQANSSLSQTLYVVSTSADGTLGKLNISKSATITFTFNIDLDVTLSSTKGSLNVFYSSYNYLNTSNPYGSVTPPVTPPLNPYPGVSAQISGKNLVITAPSATTGWGAVGSTFNINYKVYTANEDIYDVDSFIFTIK